MARTETKYPPDEAPKATRGSFWSLFFSTHHLIISLTMNISSPNFQHLPALDMVRTANFWVRAWRTSSLSSGKPTQLGQVEDLSQKLTALPLHPCARKRTALGVSGICQINSVPFKTSIVGLNCTKDSKLFHFCFRSPDDNMFFLPLSWTNNIKSTRIRITDSKIVIRNFWGPFQAFDLIPRFHITAK